MVKTSILQREDNIMEGSHKIKLKGLEVPVIKTTCSLYGTATLGTGQVQNMATNTFYPPLVLVTVFLFTSNIVLQHVKPRTLR